MKRRWILHGLKFAVFVLLAATVMSLVVMTLWNWIIPGLTGWKEITFLQSLGLLVLSRILFGLRMGFGWRHHGHWRARMAERWEKMTPEEREKFRQGMHARCGHHRHRGEESAAT